MFFQSVVNLFLGLEDTVSEQNSKIPQMDWYILEVVDLLLVWWKISQSNTTQCLGSSMRCPVLPFPICSLGPHNKQLLSFTSSSAGYGYINRAQTDATEFYLPYLMIEADLSLKMDSFST